jgi:hypothetical protein
MKLRMLVCCIALPALSAPPLLQAAVPDLAAAMEAAAPGLKLRGTVIAVETAHGQTSFPAWHYKNEPDATDFWPASTIKLYTAIAALEKLHAKGLPLETTLTFERRAEQEPWVLDCARSMPEMLSEIWRRSSNEDYTLLLRFTGLDEINSQFLIPDRGFTRSALMRGYWIARPYTYKKEERQRITLRAQDGRMDFAEHAWSGRSWSEERGATILDARTGNMASTRDLADCLRRVVFHDLIPESERFKISPAMVDFLKHGGHGFVGLETRDPDSGPRAWEGGKDLFPLARYYHKVGSISNEVLELAVVDDRAQSGRAWVLCLRAGSGKAQVMTDLCRAVLGELKRSLP